jgi:hypothetical protein
LVAHLSGDHIGAERLYGSAIQVLSEAGAWRGVSVFLRHRSDLLRKLNRLKAARSDIEGAITASEAGFHPDLLHFCRVSEANLRRFEAAAGRETTSGRARPVSVTEIEPTLRFAKNLGSAKLESDAYRIKAFIEMDQGDFESAYHSALDCLWLCRAYHLRLRTIASIELLGQVLHRRGDREDARRLFLESAQLARRYEYPSVIDSTERALGAMGDGRGGR